MPGVGALRQAGGKSGHPGAPGWGILPGHPDPGEKDRGGALDLLRRAPAPGVAGRVYPSAPGGTVSVHHKTQGRVPGKAERTDWNYSASAG